MSSSRPGARAQKRAGRPLGEAPDDEPRERARQRREVIDRDPVAAGERGVDDDVEDLGLVAQQVGGAHDVALGRRVHRAQRRHEAAPHAPARVTVASRSWRPRAMSRPRARHHAAVSSRVMPSSGRTSRPDRAGMPSSARRPGDAARR